MSIRSQVVVACAVAALIAECPAATIEVDSVESLVSTLASVNNNTTEILLKKSGSPYNLGTVESMSRVGHLYTVRPVSFRGETGNPEDVVLVGTTNRILYLGSDGNLTISGITFKNGDCRNNVIEKNNAPYDLQDGGAICLRGDKSPAVISNCVFVGNKAASHGGAIGNYYSLVSGRYAGTFIDCVFSNNLSLASGGAVRSTEKLIRCTFIGNQAAKGGATHHTRLVDHCIFIGNIASQGGGAMTWENVAHGAPEYVVSNSTFKLNCSTGDLGGGAIYGGNGGASSVPLVGCTFEGNYAAKYGGAVSQCKDVHGCTFVTNSAPQNGGNAYYSDVYDSTFRIADCGETAAVNGMVARDGSLNGCTVTFAGAPVNVTYLYNVSAYDTVFSGVVPRIAKGMFVYCEFDRCRFMDIVREEGSAKAPYMFGQTTSLTNCLVARCSVYSYGYNSYTNAGFYNCTFVSNSIVSFGAGGSQQRVMPVVNCLFYGNLYNGSLVDVASSWEKAVSGVTNCIFSASGSNADLYAPGEGNLNIYHTDFNPMFVGAADPGNEFALKRSSPAATMAGVVMDWMAGAYDIRGEGYPRLRDNQVNIGCYQCWLNPAGMTIILK